MSEYATGSKGSFAPPVVPQPRSWDFSGGSDRPVQLFLHTLESGEVPVRAVLRVGSRPASRVTSASIILPCDPSQADVDFNIDLERDISFPANSLIGRGGYGQVRTAVHVCACMLPSTSGMLNITCHCTHHVRFWATCRCNCQLMNTFTVSKLQYHSALSGREVQNRFGRWYL